MIEHVALELIRPNPWQTRSDPDGETLAALADDIKARDLIHAPIGRRTRSVEAVLAGDETVELAVGHRRYAAYVLLHREAPDDPRWGTIPVDVRELTDREMAEMAAAENAQRDDISAIDKAKGIERLIRDFQMTQAEAGKPFRVGTQGGVSNLLGLLKLPLEMQQLVHLGDLPERLARALRSLASIDAKAAVTAAKVIAKRDPDEREAELYEQLEAYVRGHGQSLRWTPWPLDWPPTPISSPIGDIPKCLGCTYNVRLDPRDDEDRGCIWKTCFGAKLKAWAEAEAARVASQHGISVAGPKEKVTILYDGSDWKKREFAVAALQTKHASLRAIAVYTKIRNGGYGLEGVSGSEYVLIGSVDVSALRQAMRSAPKLKPKPEKRKLDAWEKKQQARLAVERERRKYVRALVSAATPAFAPLVPDPLIDILYDRLRYTHGLADRPAKVEAWKKADAAGRKAMLMGALLDGYVGTSYTPNPETATKKIDALARAAHVKLPRGWNSAPSPNSKTPKPKAKAKRKKP